MDKNHFIVIDKLMSDISVTGMAVLKNGKRIDPKSMLGYPCNVCGKVCKSLAGLNSHKRTHIIKDITE